MTTHNISNPEERPFLPRPVSTQIDLPEARQAYAQTISNPKDRHLEVGILTPEGKVLSAKLGKNEEYGSHRVGSVTKTFTALLTLKLIHDGKLPNGLKTRCGEIIPEDILKKVFENPTDAANMTLEQLLSHTAGLEYDDHCRKQESPSTTLHERFLQESTPQGRQFKHTSKPGEGLGTYSNAGLAVVGWMLEIAYNKGKIPPQTLFSEIMKKELFENVFGLSQSFIAPGIDGDIIQSAAGDMTSSVADLMKVAARLQKGEADLEPIFGTSWQQEMLRPRDLLQQHGLGCEARTLEHKGLNREQFGHEERDVSALVVFPLKPGDTGVVAICDSNALGPDGKELINSLKRAAGIHSTEEPTYKPVFYCPESPDAHLFHGNAYLVTDVDPFDSPSLINCSLNGMKHVLTRMTSLDKPGIVGYKDQHDKPWVVITRTDGSKAIYSNGCLVTQEIQKGSIAEAQPDVKSIKLIEGIYQNAEKPQEHPQFTFSEKHGHLFMKEDNGDSYPCLYIPSKDAWVSGKPGGREVQFRFPKNPDKEYVLITDILNDVQQQPKQCIRTGPVHQIVF